MNPSSQQQELREQVTREVLGSDHIRYEDLVEYAKQNVLDNDRKQSVDNIMRAIHSHMQAGFDYVLQEDEDLNAPLDRTIDGNPESDKYPLLYVIRRAVRNVFRLDARKRAAKYLKGEL